jgi:hypothetical protein
MPNMALNRSAGTRRFYFFSFPGRARLAIALSVMKKLLPLLLLVPEMAHAEVMDKEPSLLAVWGWAVISAALLFAVVRFRPWLLFGVAPLPALFFYGLLSEVIDPFVGPAMLREAGNVYIVSSWVVPVLPIAGVFAGWWLRRRRIAAQQGAPADAAKRRV